MKALVVALIVVNIGILIAVPYRPLCQGVLRSEQPVPYLMPPQPQSPPPCNTQPGGCVEH